MFETSRRDLAFVPRWSTSRVIRRQSVAEHSYYACAYGLEIASRIGWPTLPDMMICYRRLNELALYLLRHDESESIESDIPGPIKRMSEYKIDNLKSVVASRYGEPPIYDREMLAIRKTADLLDECMYLAGEVNMGNRHVLSSLENSRRRLTMSIHNLPASPEDKIKLSIGLERLIITEISGVRDIRGLVEETLPPSEE